MALSNTRAECCSTLLHLVGSLGCIVSAAAGGAAFRWEMVASNSLIRVDNALVCALFSPCQGFIFLLPQACGEPFLDLACLVCDEDDLLTGCQQFTFSRLHSLKDSVPNRSHHVLGIVELVPQTFVR